MKTKYLALIVFSIALILQSCVKEEDPGEARLNPESLNSQAALEAAVAGMYNKFTLYNQFDQSWTRAWGADDVTTHSASNKIGFRDSDLMKVTPSSSNLTDSYNPPYATIKEANNIIANKNNFIGGNVLVTNYMIGEAYFLRAYCYFKLVRDFGRVPLITSADITGNTHLTRASLLEIYTQVESDFKQAEILLPAKYPATPAAIRPNIGSAKAFLAKLYTHWAGWPLKDASKYAMAAAKAKEVIDNASTYGFALVPDLKTLWSIKDQNRFNTEIVFGLGHLNTTYSNRHAGRVGYPVQANGWEENFAEIAFMNDFPAGYRKNATYRTSFIYPYNNGTGPVLQWQNLTNERHPMFFKVTGYQDEIDSANSTTTMTTYCMRYADLLLMYAEAVGRSGGNTPDAWEALNKVRRRANNLPVNTPNPSVDLISGNLAELAYTERKWELAGEFQRWDDLARMERVAAALANRSPEEKVVGPMGDTSPANYFLPIPQSEIDIAPQLAN